MSDLPAKYRPDLLAPWLRRFDRENTRKAYEDDIMLFFGTTRVGLELARSVKPFHINGFIEQMETKGCAPSTIQRRVSALRSFFSWLGAYQAVEANPANPHLIHKITTASEGTIYTLSKKELRQIVRVAAEQKTGVRDEALIKTLVYLALRRSEAADMDVAHIKTSGSYYVLEIPAAKGGTDQTVKIPDHLHEALQDHLFHYGINEGPIWRSLSNNARGSRLTEKSIYRIIKRTAQRAGIKKEISPHTLRHTACTLALENGATLKQVQTHARHKDSSTTIKYIHNRDKLENSAADLIRF